MFKCARSECGNALYDAVWHAACRLYIRPSLINKIASVQIWPLHIDPFTSATHPKSRVIINNEIITKRGKISPVGCWRFFIIQLWARRRVILFSSTVENEQQRFTQNIVASVGAKKLSLSLLPGVIIIALPESSVNARTQEGQRQRPLPQLLLLVSHFTLCILLLKIIQRKSALICSAEQFAKCMYMQILQIR